MAIIQQQNDPNNQQNQNQQNSSAPSSSGPQSVTMPSPMNAPSQVSQPTEQSKPSASSGKFTNVQSFLGANQGAGNRMASNVASNVSDKAASIRQGVQQAQTNFQQQANPEQQRLQQGQTLVNNAMNNAQEFVKDPNQLQQFSQLRQGQVAQLQNPQDALSQQQFDAQNLQKTVQSGNTEEGRFGLLKQAFQGPTYGRGAQRLDQLLLERDTQTPGQNMLQQKLQSAYGNVDKDVTNELTGEQQQIKSIQDLAKQRQDEINQGLGDVDKGGLIGGLASDLNKRVQDQNSLYSKDAVGDLQSRLAAISSGNEKYKDASGQEKDINLSQDELDRLGLKSDSNLYGSDIEHLINSSAAGRQFSKEEMANQGDYTKYGALQQLAGRDIGLLGQKQDYKAPELFNVKNFDPNSGKNLYDKQVNALNLGKIAEFNIEAQKQKQALQEQLRGQVETARNRRLGMIAPEDYKNASDKDLLNEVLSASNSNDPTIMGYGNAIGASTVEEAADRAALYRQAGSTQSTNGYWNTFRDLQGDLPNRTASGAAQLLTERQKQASDYQNKFNNATLQRYLKGNNNGTPTV